MATESNSRSDQQDAAEPTPVTPAPPSASGESSRGATRTVLAATGIAVGSVLLLGLTFGGGVLLGTNLPDRGPGGPVMANEAVERLQDRLEERRDQREDRRDERRDRIQEHRELQETTLEQTPEQ